jgi:ATP-dependent protease HslVU (ClpYQ) peptidase subunit
MIIQSFIFVGSNMTCIVAYEKDGKVWMGGDSAGVDGESLRISARGDQKVFQNGEYLIGFTTSFRMGQLLRYKFNPSPCPDWDLEKHMTTTFVDQVRECFSKNGFDKKSEHGQHNGGTFLIGTHGRIFVIHDDFQLGWNRVPYNSCGCGHALALGCMYGLHNQDCEPELIVQLALESAAEFSAGVRGPFHIMSV